MSKDPSWTAKEWLFAAYGVVASALAGYGGANLTAVIFGPAMRSDPVAFTVMVAVFVATLLLTLTGVEHIKSERFKAWMKEWEARQESHEKVSRPDPAHLPILTREHLPAIDGGHGGSFAQRPTRIARLKCVSLVAEERDAGSSMAYKSA